MLVILLFYPYVTMEEASNKRVRGVNFSTNERNLLLSLILKHKHIVENKQTDGTTCQAKTKAWDSITREFNSQSPNAVHRTSDSLKKFYTNEKKKVRKAAAEDRREFYRTGGGTKPPSLLKNIDVMGQLLNEKTVHGLPVATFDSDNIGIEDVSEYQQYEDQYYETTDASNPVAAMYNLQNEAGASNKRSNLGPSCSDNEASTSNSGNNWEEVLLVVEHANESSRSPMDENKNGFEKKRRRTISGESTQGTANLSRRRPIVTALTTSKIAERYDQLLDKRLAIADVDYARQQALMEFEKRQIEKFERFQDQQHQLYLENLKLDIALKRKLLNGE